MVRTKTNKKHSRNLHASRLRTNYICPPAARKIILAIIPITFIAVAIAIVCSFTLNPERLTTTKIAELSADYYENYFYPELASTAEATGTPLDQTMTKFAVRGFTPITLRQLLYYDDQKNAALADGILTYCDENSTIIRIFPDPPYGQSDYHIEYTYSCNF